jgi:hypothetical protein
MTWRPVRNDPLGLGNTCECEHAADLSDLCTYEEALTCHDAAQWVLACEAEMGA